MKEAKPVKSNAPEQWEVDSALDTLMRAEEIKSNKKLMMQVSKKLDKKAMAIKSLKDLKMAANAVNEDDEDDSEEMDDEEE